MADATTEGAEPPAEKPKYDQDFFLALAAKGKDVWNTWRRDPANKDVRVTFAGVDFSQAPNQINFEGFEFGGGADFSRCKWRYGWSSLLPPKAFTPGRAYFKSAAFGDGARFTGAAFDYFANFTGAAFGAFARFRNAAFADSANFAGAAFGLHASFAGAAFRHQASFARTAFGGSASFVCATFGFAANFAGAAFGAFASFHGAAFGDRTRFEYTIFKGKTEFSGRSEEQWARNIVTKERFSMNIMGLAVEDEETRLAHEKRHQDSWTHENSRPHRFLSISFANARFDGEAIFSGRSVEQRADFSNTLFYSPPNFDGVTNASRIDFTGAHIGFARRGRLPWTSKTQIPVRLRALRKIAEETKNHDLERDLYIEERKAERGVYLRQLLDELKKRPTNSKGRSKISENKKRMSGWNGGSSAGRAMPTGLGSQLKLRGFSRTSSGSVSWASTG